MSDWSKPTVTSQYVSFVNEINNKFIDLAKGIPSSGEYVSLPIDTISFRSNKWQKWDGTNWSDLSSGYAISITGTASNITGTLAVARGGTNITSYTIGDLLYASGATSLARLTAVASGNVLKSGGVSAPPTWGKLNLVSDVEGTLPVSRGGSGATNLSGILKGNGTGAFSAAIPGIDYAAGSHTHPYLALDGSSAMTGDLSIIDGVNEKRINLGPGEGRIFGSLTEIGISKASGAQFAVNLTTGTISTNGGLTIGGSGTISGNLTVSGNIVSSNNVTATGNVTILSDKRLKSNVKTITSALDKVRRLRGVSYIKDHQKSIGLIAQELEVEFPELVFTDDNGFKSVAYANLVAVLIEAIKELDGNR